MGLLDLFITSSIPVLKVLLITAVGSFLALDKVNLLGAEARKHLNNIVFFVFSPSLISSSLAKTITYESVIKLWFMPVNVLITFIVGSALGWVVNKITNVPSHLRGLIVGCCAAGNLGNLLLIIIPAVCKEKGSPFGDPDTCHQYGLAYASLSMALGAVYIWSYVYNIMRISSTKSLNEVDIKGSSETSVLPSRSCEEPLLSSEGKTQVATLDWVKQRVSTCLRKIDLKRLFAPSTIGAIVGFTIGIVPLIRKSMIGETAPLRVIQDSVSLVGDGAIPSLTLIVGGNLLRGLRGSGIKMTILIGIIVARYIFLPMIGIVVVKGAVYLGLVHEDPLYQFVLLIQFALPPAMNIGTITQLFGAGESECSVIMLWTYALASISLTIWSTFFMWLVS